MKNFTGALTPVAEASRLKLFLFMKDEMERRLQGLNEARQMQAFYLGKLEEYHIVERELFAEEYVSHILLTPPARLSLITHYYISWHVSMH